MCPVILDYHPDEFEDEVKWVWKSSTLGLTLRIRILLVSTNYLIVDLRENGGFVLLEEGSGPWHELRGFLLKNWSAKYGGIAEEDDRTSFLQPSVNVENVDSLRLEPIERLTRYFAYFKDSAT